VLSSHLISDLAQVCDYLIILSAARVQVAAPIGDLLAAHHSLSLEDVVLGYLSRGA
jgi:ABC-2 type transport system ATP-binding protein